MSKAREVIQLCEGSNTVLDQVRSLSSGTIAGLIKNNKYSEIDKVHGKFVQFVIGATNSDPKAYKNWQEAWDYFKKTYDLKTLKLK